ncbi:nickel pincer cofactor biosynthesis protein LarB [Nocardioides litoris]|uniref:nickel pincer cofactor biosynthesis protein LarB n=1 Tax=Nocardioides litoris TaxID=1926648 RepID=UPI0011244C5A|nr:nickel pincer cofactor biosynthesis protein LarB [Nocardioides litoris]
MSEQAPVTELPELRIDHLREARTGLAEAVYGPGKTPDQCAAAVAELLAGPGDGPVLLTRADPAQAAAATAAAPGAAVASYDEGQELRTLLWRARERREHAGSVLVLTAGTGDLPVAREAAAVVEAYGHEVALVADVGVAGLHRVLGQQDRLAAADVVVVVAGMEGALASVVGGLTRAPVVAVPTSTGYGAGLEGVTALLGMLASCSPGITAVGIDNGFGAGCAAVRFLGARVDA